MENKNWKVKMKNIITERDNRFWLMIFVVLSTIAIFVVWSMNLKNIFPKKDISQEASDLGLNQIKTELQEDKDSFLEILEKLEEKNSAKKINQTEVEKLKEAIGNKVEENNLSGTSTDNNISTSTSSSSIPVISQDLDNSEQEIDELRKKIEELEKKLGN